MIKNTKPVGTEFVYLICIVIFSIVISISHTPYGTAMSMDSLSYLSAAQQIVLGNGVSTPNFALGEPDYKPMILWPPLYPITLAILTPSSSLFDNPEASIAVINALAYFLAMAIFWHLCRKIIRQDIATIVAALMALSPSMQVVYLYAWSETIFIPFILIAFFAHWNFISAPKDKQEKWMYITVAAISVAIYFRYAGFGFLAAFYISIVFSKSFNFLRSIHLIAKSSLIFALFLAPLFIRNYLLTSTVIGIRDQPNADLIQDLELLVYFVKDEFFPVSAVWLIATLLITAISIFIEKYKFKPTTKKDSSSHINESSFVWLSLIWSLTYFLFLIVNRQLSIMDLDPRMVAPAVPLIILGVTAGVIWLYKKTSLKAIYVPFIVLSILLFFRSYDIHKNIITAWKTTGEPGVIQNIEYKTVLNSSTIPLKTLQESIKLSPGSVLLTDITPTSYVQYFFPHSRIKMLPMDISKSTEDLLAFTKNPGLIVLTKSNSIERLDSALNTKNEFIKLQGHKDLSYFVLMKLPVQNH